MKTRIIVLIAAVALVTLSFTFASVESPKKFISKEVRTSNASAQIGGLVSDEVIK